MAERVQGRLILRGNRFVAEVEIGGRTALAHVPNSGRMTELMVPGAPVVLVPAPLGSERRTQFDLTAILYRERWVGVDSRMPPALVIDAWRAGLLPGLASYTDVRREVTFGESRLDLLFDGPPGLAYVEAKSVNLVEDGVAMFPDAPTIRGTRHLRELAKAASEGHAAAVCFVIQRDDAEVLRPYAEADPAFAEALASVVSDGVAAYAIACATTPDGQKPVRLVPVEISSGVFA
ncbi:MAG: DNA/RNA nuclease SfsA [Chloroflexi bacterium]|nr:DNA/RNA nuclease SfsA [Chloroflexota bacterium]